MLANRLLDPGSKRRTITEWLSTVAMPKDVDDPEPRPCYRAVDALADAKESTEAHLYSELCKLTNLDLRLVCYDLTSTLLRDPGRRPAESSPRSPTATAATTAATGPRS